MPSCSYPSLGFLIIVLMKNTPYASCLSLKPSTYKVFNIPSITVDLTFASSSSVSSPSTQLEISTKIKSATSSYLFDYFDSIISQYDHDQQSWATFEGIELQVSLHTGDDGQGMVVGNNPKHTQIVAEMSGKVSFSRTKLEHGFTLDEKKVEELTYKAFIGQYAMDDYSSKIEDILPNVLNLKVQTDYDGNSNQSSGVNLGFIMMTLAITSTFFLLSFWCYRYHQVKNGERCTRKGHLLMDMDNHSDCYNEDELGNFTDFTYEQTCESEPVLFIPVPARINEVVHGNGRRSNMTTKQPEVTPRRYVSPASPFELLYGAAFSHRDRKKVQKAKKKSNRFFYAPRAKQMKPLNTITEVNEDENNNNESFFPQIVSSITSFISDISEKMDGQKNREDFVVFRDFPRHDGTPCVMFTPVGEVDWEAKNRQQDEEVPSNSAYRQNNITDTNEEEYDSDLSYNPSITSLVNLKDGNSKDVDSFVDKLESLMADRSRQYEERKKFEAELEEDKRKRAATKSCGKTAPVAPTEKIEYESSTLFSPSDHENGHPPSEKLINVCLDETIQQEKDTATKEHYLLNLNNQGAKEVHEISTSNYAFSNVSTDNISDDYLIKVSNSLPCHKEEITLVTVEEQLATKKMGGCAKTDGSDGKINERKENESVGTANKLESPRDVETSHFSSEDSSAVKIGSVV